VLAIVPGAIERARGRLAVPVIAAGAIERALDSHRAFSPPYQDGS
jgi:hypothetical protein